MRETKRRIPQFAFYDKTGIQTYLEKQAEQQRMQEAVEMQEGADEPQVPGGTQTMGMG